MTAHDRLWISLRHMKTGVVGVLLVVVATAIGIALAASTSAFIRAYREQTKRLLNHPVYRKGGTGSLPILMWRGTHFQKVKRALGFRLQGM